MSDLIAAIQRKIGKWRLFYVCRDAERAAAGLLLKLPNFYIITNDSPYARELQKKYKKNILTIKNKKQLDTHELLAYCHPERSEGSKTLKDPSVANRSLRMTIGPNDFIMVFKPTVQIEKICRQNHWQLLNPSAALASKVEEKLSQINWLGNLKKYLPGYKIQKIKDVKFARQPFIIQFAHSHTGSGTILIKTKKQLDELKKKFPDRPARVARYIAGPLFTNNNIVWADKILLGNISYQITGLKPFTDREFATIGNDWHLPDKILTKTQIAHYKKIALDVGKKLMADGWRGLFGIDAVMEAKTKKLYLLEINARQPASTTYESELQQRAEQGTGNREQKNKLLLNTFAAHLAALLGIKYHDEKLIKINDGAQIILRKNQKLNIKYQKYKSKLKNYKIIEYPKPKGNADWLRIQSEGGIMDGHGKFNNFGKEIVKSIPN